MPEQEFKDPYPDLTIPELVEPEAFIRQIKKYKNHPQGDILLKNFIDNHTHDLAFFEEVDKKPILDVYYDCRKHFEGKKKK